MSDVKAIDIKNALSKRHWKEFFITECKTGPTGTGLLIFDALAIFKSWTNPRIIGYEVKISRSDFLRDTKFWQYMPYCHEFYIVCPTGMIDRTELTENIGLIYYNHETGALTTKKKAIWRNVEISGDMLMYIIMNRLDSDRLPWASDRREYWKAWLQNKLNNRELSHRIKNRITEELHELETAKITADRGIERNKEYREELDRIDTMIHRYTGSAHIWGDRSEKIEKLIAKEYPPEIDKIEADLNTALATIAKYKLKMKKQEDKKDEQIKN